MFLLFREGCCTVCASIGLDVDMSDDFEVSISIVTCANHVRLLLSKIIFQKERKGMCADTVVRFLLLILLVTNLTF